MRIDAGGMKRGARTSAASAGRHGLRLWLLLLALAGSVEAQSIAVPNPGFEVGTPGEGPLGWTLFGRGAWWLEEGTGRHAITATGNGNDTSYWRGAALPLTADGVYRVSFVARGVAGGGGTPITGPVFCNVDLGDVGTEWTRYEEIFAAPHRITEALAWLRFGQWHRDGTVAFDDISVTPVQPVYAQVGDLRLGEGEAVHGTDYVFRAPLRTSSRNHSRPLAWHQCGFNSYRLVFGAGSELVYRHRLGRRQQLSAEFDVNVGWYSGGKLEVAVSTDGDRWLALGVQDTLGTVTYVVPGELLPAVEVWVRCRSLAQRRLGTESDPGSLQIHDYTYRSRFSGGPVEGRGYSRYAAVLAQEGPASVHLTALGRMVPGRRDTVVLQVHNPTGRALTLRGSVQVDALPPPSAAASGTDAGRLAAEATAQGGNPQGAGGADGGKSMAAAAGPAARPTAVPRGMPEGAPQVTHLEVRIPPDTSYLHLPYVFRGTGERHMRVVLAGDEQHYLADIVFHVPELYASSYGHLLPESSAAVGLWWASSGWKVFRERGLPAATSASLLIRAARNEVEAAQLVLRPQQPLRRLRLQPGELTGADGTRIPATAVEVLRVAYVPVTRPTDPTGAAGMWPDPLPPVRGPVDLEAGMNQPFWVRVKVPRGVSAGTYRGKIRLQADGYRGSVSLLVEVYDFDLPDRMSCRTAFGFSPANVWRYQGLSRETDRRAVLDLYLDDYAAHHISPYDPAPLDPPQVEWPEVPDSVATGQVLTPRIDWGAWDQAMCRALDERHFTTFRLTIPGMGGGTYQARREPRLLGYGAGTTAYAALFRGYVGEVQEHLRQRGWLDEAFVYWFDEPDPKDYAFVMAGFQRLAAAGPEITRMLTEQVEPQLIGGPDLWCPVSYNFQPREAAARQALGEHFWWYICTGPKAPYCTLFIDHPATELRVWLWQTWKRHLDGILVWQTNYWTSEAAYPDHPQNPYTDPMGWVSGYSTAAGTRRAWGNGDGRFVYPPLAAADVAAVPVRDGPVDSIRWEMLRDGLEDYEYLAILRRLLDRCDGDLEAQRRDAYHRLLEVPETISHSLTRFTRDPGPLEAQRDRIARAVEELRALAGSAIPPAAEGR